MNSDEVLLRETDHFRLTAGEVPEHMVENGQTRRGFMITNKAYDVVEALGASEAVAIRTLYNMQAQLEAVLADPTGEGEQDAAIAEFLSSSSETPPESVH